MADDLLCQNFCTFQNQLQPQPNTIASAATVAPSTLITYISGTAQIETVTPPLTGQHMLIFVFTNASPGTFLTSGNVLNAIVPTQNLPTFLFYDPSQGKYFGCASNLT